MAPESAVRITLSMFAALPLAITITSSSVADTISDASVPARLTDANAPPPWPRRLVPVMVTLVPT